MEYATFLRGESNLIYQLSQSELEQQTDHQLIGRHLPFLHEFITRLTLKGIQNEFI